jgi:glutathione S-transferase
MLELYHSDLSVCSQKVRLVLEEKQLQWIGHRLDLRGRDGGDQFKPEYLKLNPRAQVPTLVHDGRPIRESTLINEYLDGIGPSAALIHGDRFTQYQIRLWAKIPDDGLHTACADITYVSSIRKLLREKGPQDLERQLTGSPDPAKQDRLRQAYELGADAPMIRYAVHLYNRTLSEMEFALEASAWLVGARFSIADAALTPYVFRLEMLGMEDMLGDTPNVQRWLAAIKERESFEKGVLQFIQPEIKEVWLSSGRAVWPQIKSRYFQ